MSKIEIISKSDFIISFATILEENIDIKNTIIEAVKNGSDFVYMHPIDNADLKLLKNYFQDNIGKYKNFSTYDKFLTE